MSKLNQRKVQSVDGEILPQSHVYDTKSGNFGVAYRNDKGKAPTPEPWDYLMAPFNQSPNHVQPGVFSTILVAILTWLAAFMFGFISVLALDRAIVTGLPVVLTALTIAFIQAGLVIAISSWTYETYLPTYVFPEYSLLMVCTGKLGLVPALGQAAFSIFGYCMAGLALKGLLPTGTIAVNVTNIPNSALTFILFYIGACFIMLNWIWNHEFSISEKGTKHNRKRAVMTQALALFVLIIAFYGNETVATAQGYGLVFYSPGPYLTGLIFGNNVDNGGPGSYTNSVVGYPWAYFVFVGLLAVPVTLALIFFIFQFMTGYNAGRKGGYVQQAPEVPPSDLQSNINKQPLLGRPIHVKY